jgi:hypothetical protein
MLSQRGKEILARRPPLPTDTSDVEQDFMPAKVPAVPQPSCNSYVVELPAHEIEEVSAAKRQATSSRISRHSLMAISSALLLSVTAIVLLAVDSSDVQDISSALLLPGGQDGASTVKNSVKTAVSHTLSAELKSATDKSTTLKESAKSSISRIAAQAKSASGKKDNTNQNSADTESSKPAAKSLRAAARAKAGAALFARAVRSTEMTLADPSRLEGGLASVDRPAKAAPTQRLAAPMQQLQGQYPAQYPQYQAYATPYNYRPVRPAAPYAAARQPAPYPAYAYPPNQYAYPAVAGNARPPAQSYPPVSAYAQQPAFGSPSAQYAYPEGGKQGQAAVAPQGQYPQMYSSPQAPVESLSAQRQPVASRALPGPVLKGTWQYPAYARPRQASAVAYAPAHAAQQGGYGAHPPQQAQQANYGAAARPLQQANYPQTRPAAAQMQQGMQQPAPQQRLAAGQPQAPQAAAPAPLPAVAPPPVLPALPAVRAPSLSPPHAFSGARLMTGACVRRSR